MGLLWAVYSTVHIPWLLYAHIVNKAEGSGIAGGLLVGPFWPFQCKQTSEQEPSDEKEHKCMGCLAFLGHPHSCLGFVSQEISS